MKILVGFLIAGILFAACQSNESNPTAQKETATVLPIEGTWKLISGTLIEKGDTNVTDYTKGVSFIKIINNDHFAFLTHDTKGAADSAKTFDAGGGSYTLKDSSYTEHLQYCLEREWEGHDFTFTVTIKNDTLIQRGIEKVPNTGTERLNIEKYVRMK
jgi:predicted small secreted protein